MKKLLLYLFVITLSAVSFTSCSSDDNSTPEPVQPQNKLVGKWDLKFISAKIFINDELSQQIDNQPVEGLLTMQFEFKENNTVSLYMHTPASDESEEIIQEHEGTYRYNGTNLYITVEDEEQLFIIENNTESSLVLLQSYEEEYQGMLIRQETLLDFSKI